MFQGLMSVMAGRAAVGCTHLEDARRVLDADGDVVGVARCDAILGLAAAFEREPTVARRSVEDSLAAYVAAGDRWGEGQAHTYLGIIYERLGDDRRATQHNRLAAERFAPFRDRTLLPAAFVSQASVLVRRDPERALKLVAAARAIKTRDGGDFPPLLRDRAEQVQAAAEAAVGGETDLLVKVGARLDPEQTFALAFGGTGTSTRTAPVAGLSTREQEVARLVADGMPNKMIATQLHLSVRTVESHVRSVLTKLGFTNRTQLATWARDRLS
jgi:non-specific serine/threonine protein kinase